MRVGALLFCFALLLIKKSNRVFETGLVGLAETQLFSFSLKTLCANWDYRDMLENLGIQNACIMKQCRGLSADYLKLQTFIMVHDYIRLIYS